MRVLAVQRCGVGLLLGGLPAPLVLTPDPAEVAETIRAVTGAGAIGVNMEDGTKSPDLLCAKIAAAIRPALAAPAAPMAMVATG